MNALNIINAIVLTLGIPVIIGAFVLAGRKLQLLDTLQESTSKMKHNLNIISHFLTRNQSKFNPAELQAMSPLQLTTVGSALIKDLGFENVFTANKKDFFDFIDSEAPKLKYDVELLAIKSIYVLADKPYFDFLKVFFYNKPNRTLEDTAPTLGVYVRDQYLVAHKEITQ